MCSPKGFWAFLEIAGYGEEGIRVRFITENEVGVLGKIVYKKSEEDAKMKEISFKNAYIVHYKETLDVNNEAPMTIAMTFSAENITVGNAELDNRWPRS